MKLKTQNPYRAVSTVGVSIALGIATVATGFAQDAQPRAKDRDQQQPQYRESSPKALGNQRNSTQTDQAKPGDTVTEFIKKAAKCGVMEVKLGKLGVEKAQNPSVKQFAQTLVTDHTRANQQLMQLAARKGVMLPSDIQQQLSQTDAAAVALDKTKPDRTPNEQIQPGTATENRFQATPGAVQDRQPVRDASKPENREQNRTVRDEPRAIVGQQHDQAAHDKDAEDAMNKLKELSGTEFDRAFVEHAVKHHEKGVKACEEAAQTLSDPEVKAFAATTLPTLRQHLQTARSLQTVTRTP